ncbi:MAG: thioredoxin family protein [Comamonadaceae bacterium]
MNLETMVPPASALVVCLCADWCGVCREYQSRFTQVQARYAQVEFLWIDVEDEADLLHPLDIKDFPTLLLAVGNEPRFLGPVTPQAEMLERLIRSQIQDAAAPALADKSVSDLVLRIRSMTSA